MIFSERKGLKPIKSAIQVDSMDTDLRNGLWNSLTIFYWKKIFIYSGYITGDDKELFRKLWLYYFKLPLDTLDYDWEKMYSFLRKKYFEYSWNEVYDFIEFLMSIQARDSINQEKGNFINYCNMILEREVSAYRIVGDKITEITSQEEINEIEEAVERAKHLKPIYLHLKSSLDFLSNRKSPDYRNSIKEAISAVESICKKIANDEKATLGIALKKLESKVKIHPALKKAFDNIYGYTSNEDGIRHALMEESELDFEDAKFMLVSCSAFINYLLTKSLKASVELK